MHLPGGYWLGKALALSSLDTPDYPVPGLHAEAKL
jgi:hypothetical protein